MIPAKRTVKGLRLNLFAVYEFFDLYMHSRLRAFFAAIIVDIVANMDNMIFTDNFDFIEVFAVSPMSLTKHEFEILREKKDYLIKYVYYFLKNESKYYSERSFNFESDYGEFKRPEAWEECQANIFAKQDRIFMETVLKNIISPYFYASESFRHRIGAYQGEFRYCTETCDSLAMRKFVWTQRALRMMANDKINYALRNSSIRSLPVLGCLSLACTLICTFAEIEEIQKVVDKFEHDVVSHISDPKSVSFLCKCYKKAIISITKTKLFLRWSNDNFCHF
jgi:hypothetical protein